MSYGARLAALADVRPDDIAYTVYPADGGTPQRHSYGELDRAADRVARQLTAIGVELGDLIAIALPAGLPHAAATYGAWRVGAGVIALNPAVPGWELERLLAVAQARLVIGDVTCPESVGRLTQTDIDAALKGPGVERFPSQIPPRAIVLTSGGSTGVPKLIDSFGPGAPVPGRAQGPLFEPLRLAGVSRILIASPMYHGLGFANVFLNLHNGMHVTCLARFTPESFITAVEEERIEYTIVVPTMMQRLMLSPALQQADLGSLRTLFHAGSACPPWLKRAWIERVGPDVVLEYYGASEQHGWAIIDGREWLEHPGSIGRPLLCEARVLDADGNVLPNGEVGELYMRALGASGPAYEYINRERGPVTSDGFASVGDLGWMDDSGYLYIADRRADLIISGGANVFPAEVEAAISQLDGVADVAVIGIPDAEWGRRVHAVVEPLPGRELTERQIIEHCAQHLMPYKAPKTVELIEQLPRNEAGKIRRADLVAARAERS